MLLYWLYLYGLVVGYFRFFLSFLLVFLSDWLFLLLFLTYFEEFGIRLNCLVVCEIKEGISMLYMWELDDIELEIRSEFEER